MMPKPPVQRHRLTSVNLATSSAPIHSNVSLYRSQAPVVTTDPNFGICNVELTPSSPTQNHHKLHNHPLISNHHRQLL
ncbi:hypothetical protein M0R45_029265 [Rubus argutus]|uniref:Uncharacterized protein n=1 Tax=Rubus argutus TaxID=59490 RepID=A0AAW1W9U2_RUBAR